jgi:hypothetical protein
MTGSKSNARKEKQKYYYYIGQGNNCNLIRSLMRKRGWWTEVDSVSKAHFVWTQLRVTAVLDRLETFSDDDWNTDTILYEEI